MRSRNRNRYYDGDYDDDETPMWQKVIAAVIVLLVFALFLFAYIHYDLGGSDIRSLRPQNRSHLNQVIIHGPRGPTEDDRKAHVFRFFYKKTCRNLVSVVKYR